MSAKTRSWEQAERAAQAERDKRDPVKIELQKIAEQEAAKVAVQLKPLKDTLEQWLTGMKGPGQTSINSYRSTTRKIQRRAKRVGVVYVSEASPAMAADLPPGNLSHLYSVSRTA